jgi:hypothetical protein
LPRWLPHASAWNGRSYSSNRERGSHWQVRAGDPFPGPDYLFVPQVEQRRALCDIRLRRSARAGLGVERGEASAEVADGRRRVSLVMVVWKIQYPIFRPDQGPLAGPQRRPAGRLADLAGGRPRTQLQAWQFNPFVERLNALPLPGQHVQAASP